MAALLIWSIAVATIAGILFRPKEWPEAVWASLGAALLVVLGLLPPASAWRAIGKGTDVYLFLAGMMLLAELARKQGVFDWLASRAVEAANGSRSKLFFLVYAVGTLVTIFLSNDATAVVLTPAVYAAVKKARVPALPYLLCCAFIANAASFVLPISNPANLVVYGKQIPALLPWVRVFALPSLLSIAATFLILRRLSKPDLAGIVEDDLEIPVLTREARRSIWGLAVAGAVMICASALSLDLGLPTFVAAFIVMLLVAAGAQPGAKQSLVMAVVRDVSWAVLPLVAGLFVIVAALDRAGAQQLLVEAARNCAKMQPVVASLTASFGVAGLANIMNNLPSGLLAGSALQAIRLPDYVRHAVLIGADLGPNLSVTGSLATLLWLIALRREGERVSGWTFLKTGLWVMPPALLLATLALAMTAA
jgi:arsenical pump membrane protein